VPFTPSHAIVALPFVRTPLMPAAVAIGAMTPDVPLFFRGFALDYSRTHSFTWVPATVLLALVLLLVWRCLIRPAARELSPDWLASRLPALWDRGAAGALGETLGVSSVRAPGARRRWRVSWSALALLAAALAIGVVSHIAWDLFTHEGRAGVTAIPALDARWGPLLGYKWLQYGSSVIGVVILAVFAARWLSRRDAAASVVRILPHWVRWAWWLSLPVLLVVTWVGAVQGHGLEGPHAVEILAYSELPPACARWAVASVLLCIVVQGARWSAALTKREAPSR
jgi:hypothetical protein